jgi:hypothetical protein
LLRGWILGFNRSISYERCWGSIGDPACLMTTEWVYVPALLVHGANPMSRALCRRFPECL